MRNQDPKRQNTRVKLRYQIQHEVETNSPNTQETIQNKENKGTRQREMQMVKKI